MVNTWVNTAPIELDVRIKEFTGIYTEELVLSIGDRALTPFDRLVEK
jgi:hypothetical protein